MSRVGFGKKILGLAAVLALGAAASKASASTITFASFNDLASNNWSYNAGTITGTGVSTFFSGLGAGIINYSNVATYNVTATRTGDVVAGQQGITGSMVFKDGSSNIILKVGFTGSILDQSGSLTGNISGTGVTYDSGPGPYPYQVGTFNSPFSMSISLTFNAPVTVSGSPGSINFTNFEATATGSFSSDSSGSSNSTPLPAAAWGGLSMMGALGGIGAYVRRRRR